MEVRKNRSFKSIEKFFLEKIIYFKNIDEYGIDGDFVESQAFAYLAIRSFLICQFHFPIQQDVKKKFQVE